MKCKWIEIDDNTARLKVPGGWLVRSSIMIVHIQSRNKSDSTTIEQTFVSDPFHEWIDD